MSERDEVCCARFGSEAICKRERGHTDRHHDPVTGDFWRIDQPTPDRQANDPGSYYPRGCAICGTRHTGPCRQANEDALCDRTPNCIYPKGHPGSKCYVHPENRPENEGAGAEPSEEYEEGLRDGVQMGRTAERARIATDVARTARHLRAESEMYMHHEDYIPANRCAAQAQALEDLHGELTGEHEEGA